MTDTIHHPYVPTAFTLYPDLTICSAWNGYWTWGGVARGAAPRSPDDHEGDPARLGGAAGMSWHWLARTDEAPDGALAFASLSSGGYLAAFPSDGPAPPGERKIDARALDPEGAPGRASLVLPPDGGHNRVRRPGRRRGAPGGAYGPVAGRALDARRRGRAASRARSRPSAPAIGRDSSRIRSHGSSPPRSSRSGPGCSARRPRPPAL